uniref:Uncharacterized protein n=1 Tax=Rhizophora mucronata TaxID=61149 RepID=A0A2P2NXQ6_RHIMU
MYSKFYISNLFILTGG